MKLHYSATSPYVRKVVACALACGISDQITHIETNPHVSPPDLLAANPLSKVPCLVTEDGFALFDSPVICEYLDAVGAGSLFPPPGPARWRALRFQAIGDGIMDAAVSRRMDMGRPAEAARAAARARGRAAVERARPAAVGPARQPSGHRLHFRGLRAGLPRPALRGGCLARRARQAGAMACRNGGTAGDRRVGAARLAAAHRPAFNPRVV